MILVLLNCTSNNPSRLVGRLRRYSYRITPLTKMHLLDQDFKIQNPPLDLFRYFCVAGSCNGLVCLLQDCNVLLFNPITREYKIVELDNELEKTTPPPFEFFKYRRNTSNGECVYGLGCDSDGYKLVQFISHRLDVENEHCCMAQNSKINMYSLDDSSCLTISGIPYCFANIKQWGISLKGAIHWIGKQTNTRHEKVIVCFDLGEKAIREFALPDAAVDKTSYVTLGVLGGQLCIFLNFHFEIWVMKNYGSTNSWYKLASMDTNVFTCAFEKLRCMRLFGATILMEDDVYELLSAARVLCFSKSGEILLTCAQCLVFYDPKQNTSRHIEISGLHEEYNALEKVIANVPTYVPVKSGTHLTVDGTEEQEKVTFENQFSEHISSYMLKDKISLA